MLELSQTALDDKYSYSTKTSTQVALNKLITASLRVLTSSTSRHQQNISNNTSNKKEWIHEFGSNVLNVIFCSEEWPQRNRNPHSLMLSTSPPLFLSLSFFRLAHHITPDHISSLSSVFDSLCYPCCVLDFWWIFCSFWIGSHKQRNPLIHIHTWQ